MHQVSRRLTPPFIDVGGSLPDDIRAAAKIIGTAAAHTHPVTSGYFLGTTYAAVLPDEIRAGLGVYYTPPALAERLLDQATAAGVDWSTCTVLDPACGGGAFLAPAAQRIVKQSSHLEPAALIHEVTSRIKGFELDPFAAWMSQVFVEATLLPLCRETEAPIPIMAEVCDTLMADPGPHRYDLVIGNPPYGRVSLPRDLRERYSRSLHGHANLYGIFTDVALRWVRPGGVIAYVTPTSFLSGEYFTRLRALLAREAPPASIDFIGRRKGVFDDVLQQALLATYRKNSNQSEAGAWVVAPNDIGEVSVARAGSFLLPNDGREPWLVPRSCEQSDLVARMRVMPHRLVDWGYQVSTGPLVWNRHKSQLQAQHGKGTLPLVWAEAVTQEGRFVFRAGKKNHQPYFRPKAKEDWLIVRAPCVLLQRTTAPEQGRRLYAAELPSSFLKRYGGAVVENHLNMVRPTGPRPAVPSTVLAAFLNSQVADVAFRCINGSVAVSAYELESLPLPPPKTLGPVTAMIEAGAKADDIERAFAHLYANP